MDAETMRQNLLGALIRIAEQHGTLSRNELPGTEPFVRNIQLDRSAAQVTTAKAMCLAAGIEEEAVRDVVNIGMLAS